MPVGHGFNATRPDNYDAGAVQPSHWNQPHVLTGTLAILDAIAPTPNTVFTLDGSNTLILRPTSTFASIDSPHFTGIPTVPTQTAGDNSLAIANTQFVTTAIANLIGGAPGALDTLDELAAAINDDASYAATITGLLTLKAPLASPALTGTPTAPTPAGGDNSTKIATTAFVTGELTAKAPLASPTFTGTPAAPTPTAGDSTTKIATTAFVAAAVASGTGVLDYRNIAFGNGGLEVWQRGTSIAVAGASTAYTADRWYLQTSNSQAATVAQSAGLNTRSRFSAVVQRNSGQTGTGTMWFAYPLTTEECYRLRGQRVTIQCSLAAASNWSPASGTLAVSVLTGTGAQGRRGFTPYTSETSVVNANVNLTPGGAVVNFSSTSSIAVPTSTNQMEIAFYWTPTGTAGAADLIVIDDVQLEAGTVATAYERMPFTVSLSDCLRFFRKSFPYATAPASNTGIAGAAYGIASGTNVWALIPFGMPMNGVPTVTTYNPSGAGSTWNTATTPTANAIAGESTIVITGSGATDVNGYSINWTADASL